MVRLAGHGCALLGGIDAPSLVSIRDAHYGATPLGWCCHGSLHGNTAHDHAAVARLLLNAGAQPDAAQEASASVEAVLAEWERSKARAT